MKRGKYGSNTQVMKTEVGGRNQLGYENHVQMGPKTIMEQIYYRLRRFQWKHKEICDEKYMNNSTITEL